MNKSPCAPSILVVEDESMIRMMAVDMFEAAGFQVIECDNGEDALTMFKDGGVTALFTDIDLAGQLTGVKLAHIVHDRHPDTPIIIVSGQYDGDNASLPVKAEFLGKPYDPKRVIATLEKLLAD